MTLPTVPGVKVIRITSAITDLLESYIQVAAVVAIQAGTGVDVALASQGAVARALSSYEGWAVAANAIDGNYPCPFSLCYCSATTGKHEFLEITLAQPSDLASVSVYGRPDCGYRDVYDVTLIDSGGIELMTGRVDASKFWGGCGTLEAPTRLPGAQSAKTQPAAPPAAAMAAPGLARPSSPLGSVRRTLAARLGSFLGLSDPDASN